MRLGGRMTDYLEDRIPENGEPEAPIPTSHPNEGEPPAEVNAADAGYNAPMIDGDVTETEGDDAAAVDVELIGCDSIDGDQPEDDAEQATLDYVVKRIDSLEDLFRSKISRSEYEEQVLKRYSDEIHEYKSDLYKKITLPLIKEIIGVRDATCSILERAHDNETGVSIDSVEFICDMLETALDNFGVSVQRPEIGGLPEKGTQRPIGRVKTAIREDHGAIAAVMNDAYLMDGKCVSPAKVKVFAYDESLDDSNEMQQTFARNGAEGESQAIIADVEMEPGAGMPAPAPVYKPEQD